MFYLSINKLAETVGIIVGNIIFWYFFLWLILTEDQFRKLKDSVSGLVFMLIILAIILTALNGMFCNPPASYDGDPVRF